MENLLLFIDRFQCALTLTCQAHGLRNIRGNHLPDTGQDYKGQCSVCIIRIKKLGLKKNIIVHSVE